MVYRFQLQPNILKRPLTQTISILLSVPLITSFFHLIHHTRNSPDHSSSRKTCQGKTSMEESSFLSCFSKETITDRLTVCSSSSARKPFVCELCILCDPLTSIATFISSRMRSTITFPSKGSK